MTELEVSATDLLLEQEAPQQQEQQQEQQQQQQRPRKKLSKFSSFVIREESSLGFAPCVASKIILKEIPNLQNDDAQQQSASKKKIKKNVDFPTTICSSSFHGQKINPVAMSDFVDFSRRRQRSPNEKIVKEPKFTQKDLQKALEMLEQ